MNRVSEGALRVRRALGVLLLFSSSLLGQSRRIADPSMQTVLFENDLVRVTRTLLPPRKSLPPHDHGKGLAVAVTPLRVISLREGAHRADTVIRPAGAVWWREPMRHTLKNIAKKGAEIVEFELKDTTASDSIRLARDPARIDPRHVRTEIANALVRVVRLRIDSLGTIPMHEEPQRLELWLTPFTGEAVPAAGQREKITRAAGDVAWRPDEIHSLANLAKKGAECIAVEFTSPVASSSPNVPLRRMDIGDASLYYVEKGAGETLILVHGELGDLRSWDGVVDSLARTYRVVSYSRRYHYPNPPAPARLVERSPLLTQMNDLIAVIRKTGAKRVHLAGEGEGATLVLAAALRFPKLVRSAAAVEGAFPSLLAETPEHGEYVAYRKSALEAVREAFRSRGTAGGLAAYLAYAYGDSSLDRLAPRLRPAALDNAAELGRELLVAGPEPSPRCKSLPGMTAAPILLVEGDGGPSIHRLVDDAFALCYARAERDTIAGAAYDLIYTHGPAFCNAISTFFGGGAK